MPITIIVGGQYGSEGKGKVAHWFARELGASASVRVGGPNSGHTVIDELGETHVFRHLPTAAILPRTLCVLAAGCYIDPKVLLSEIARIGLSHDRLVVDPNAMVISEADRMFEEEHQLRDRIGSTKSGTGAAVIRRVKREGETVFAANHPDLQPYVRPARPLLRKMLSVGKRVLIEGTQGYGLSLLHADHYPYVTSRDTTAAGFLAEVGLSPLDVDDVILVLRSHPIRVAGNSGPLPNEMDWSTIAEKSGNDRHMCEHTSVTRQVRRVAYFDAGVVKEAILVNQPTKVVLNHLDHIDATVRGGEAQSSSVSAFVAMVESSIARQVDFIGAGQTHLTNRSSVDGDTKEVLGERVLVG